MSIYNFDLKKYAGRNTWPALRKPRGMALVDVLLHPLRSLILEFKLFRDQKRVELSYTGQTMLLQRYLNDRFDPDEKRILIIHAQDMSTYLYFEGEGQLPFYLYHESEGAGSFLFFEGEAESVFEEDFQVSIPASLTAIAQQIREAVKKYKIAGVTYTVN